MTLDPGLNATATPATTQSHDKTVFNFMRKRKKNAQIMCCVCLMYYQVKEFPISMNCGHTTCSVCLNQYFRTKIVTGSTNISCPKPGCYDAYTPHDIMTILKDELLHNKYQDFMLRKVLMNEPDCRWCPAPDCGYAVIAAGRAACPLLKCEKCETEFCYHCKGYWHAHQTCDDARKLTNPHPVFLRGNDNATEVIKRCPRCTAHVTKMDDGSCNHMTCAVCGAEFCWLCLREVTDIHYLSPSGCTFWGKRTWSRKKRFLWQIATLIGAPFGICMLSAVAVPAILIAVPVYVGRRLNMEWKRKKSGKVKRVCVVTCGVTMASLVSPVIAVVSVSAGAPIMIAFVYTVVPFLICRGDACFGVDESNLPQTLGELNEQIQEALNLVPPTATSTPHDLPEQPEASSVAAEVASSSSSSSDPAVSEISSSSSRDSARSTTV